MAKQLRLASLLLFCLLIELGGSETATAVTTQELFEAPAEVDRPSESYFLEAYVWRDSQPLVVTGRKRANYGRIRP